MRAIVQDRYGSADVLELRDIEPPVPGPDQVLVRVRAAGVDRGVWHLMAGLPYLVRVAGYGLRKPKFPVSGMDLAGVVEAVGAEVRDFAVGDEVFGTAQGSFAELVCAKPQVLAPKPAGLTFEEAAVVPVSAVTALHAVREQGRAQAGQHVVVLGASGGVGSYAVQLAKDLGATVTGVCSAAKADFVRGLGADEVLDYRTRTLADLPRPADLIVDIGGNRKLSALRRALTPRGTLVIVGGENGGKWLGGMGRPLGGTLLSRFSSQTIRFFVAPMRRADLEHLSGRIAAGALRPTLDRTYPLERAADAIRAMLAGDVRGKLAVTV